MAGPHQIARGFSLDFDNPLDVGRHEPVGRENVAALLLFEEEGEPKGYRHALWRLEGGDLALALETLPGDNRDVLGVAEEGDLCERQGACSWELSRHYASVTFEHLYGEEGIRVWSGRIAVHVRATRFV
ncbi:hypothetical protein RUND412_003155 [Rhizina undulata]